ncbi:hypothetical protein CONPUDRAFT_77051 [Coniophora puteana RWD-64-598 SS2]|uniref:Uncharacterized protein n=1 Tax=Coniophora puteana (strain RWD-64-598) TaxID=741705 RepID=A0A5M3MBM3_CONPW|nr:uncharacterized protein CONPUDRAFT_77051 [Coniophora puteana RWD-64-598 SS2]EIW76035.1 hypothetical protein CONPUDRAFT_77051 [Coniophora puteana RWD-64-598 SS2]
MPKLLLSHMRRMRGRVRGPRPALPPETQRVHRARQRLKKNAEDNDIDELIDYIDEQILALAIKYKKSRSYFRGLFYQEASMRRRRNQKTSSWSAFLFFQALLENNGKDFKNRANVASLAGANAVYAQLTDDKRCILIAEFDKIKLQAPKKAPNLTPRARLAEVSSSFISVAQELDALSARHDVHALLVLTRGSLEFAMSPKVYTSSKGIKQYFWVNFRCDLDEFAGKMEGNMIAKIRSNRKKCKHDDRKVMAKMQIRMGLNQALVEATSDNGATMEYKRYESAIVRRYNVKLVGWEHDEWTNPSYLKGGLPVLEKLADDVTSGKCQFIKVTPEEIEERIRCIETGEAVTPNCEPRLPSAPQSSISPADAPAPTLPDASASAADTPAEPPVSTEPPPDEAQSSDPPTSLEVPVPDVVAAIFARVFGRQPLSSPSSSSPSASAPIPLPSSSTESVTAQVQEGQPDEASASNDTTEGSSSMRKRKRRQPTDAAKAPPVKCTKPADKSAGMDKPVRKSRAKKGPDVIPPDADA